MSFAKIFVLSVLYTTCLASRDLIRSNQPFGPFRFGAPFSLLNSAGSVERVSIPGFKYFDNNPVNYIDVHFNGLLSLQSATNGVPGCPRKLQGPTKLNLDVMAIFWSSYRFGKVSIMNFNKHSPSALFGASPTGITEIERDINEGFSGAAVAFAANSNNGGRTVQQRTVGNILNAYVFTWENMQNGFGSKKFDNYFFQATLVQTEDNLWFLHVYYAALGGNGEFNEVENPTGQPCAQAEFGIGRGINQVGGTYTNPFGRLPAVAECSSNAFGFTDLSTWVFDLNSGAMDQPSPPGGICGQQNEDPRCTIKRGAGTLNPITTQQPTTDPPAPTGTTSTTTPGNGTTTPTMITTTEDPDQANFNLYCRYRAPGIHAIHSLCDVFVSCSLGGVATIINCPIGTRFNPEILVCDHSRNYECFLPELNSSQIFEVTQPPSLHNNLCTYEGYGEFIDPLSCKFYYACTNSRSIRMPCPHGLFFQPSSNTTGFCDFKKNVACTGEGVRPEHPVFVTTTTPKPTDQTTQIVKSTYHPRNYH